MKLSILIPVYNVEKYIKRCLDSLYEQLESEDEIILVDDGSKDKSGTICDEYHDTHPTQTYIFHKENQGAYPTRNYALDRCTGDYIWLIDPDDYIQEGAIRSIKEKIQEGKFPDVLSIAYKRFSDLGFQELENSFNNTGSITGEDYLLNFIPNPYLWAHVYKRNFLLQNNIRFLDNLNTQGDWLFNMTVNIKANSIYLSNIYAYNYYIDNPTSTLKNPSISHRIRCVNNSLIAIDEFKEIIKNCDNKKIINPLMNFQSLNLAGFLFSLYSLNMSAPFVGYNIKKLRQRGLYPIKHISYNKKANLFLLLANRFYIFLAICKLRNVLMKEMKIETPSI